MKFVSKASDQGPVAPVPLDQSDMQLSCLFPALHEYLTAGEWDDGSSREQSTILLFMEDMIWKLCLNDRAKARSAWASGSSILSVFKALDAGLQNGTVEWRQSKGKGRK